MKKNIKKLSALLCMAVLVLGLTACSSEETGAEENSAGFGSEYMESLSVFMVENMTMMDAETMQYYTDLEAEQMQAVLDNSGLPIRAEAFQNVFSGYLSSTEDLGAYISTDGYEVSVDDEETIQVTNLTFEEHEAVMTLIFDEDGVITGSSLDLKYGLGEILEKAALNTVLGMGTVFAVLIFISFVIALLPKLTAVVDRKDKKENTEAPKAEVPVAAVPAEEELADDLELVAVISAAIAAYTGTSSDDFVVRSIKRSKANKWKKA
ncbi:MAG: OadG family protein [Lachnospiraceae bacterium]